MPSLCNREAPGGEYTRYEDMKELNQRVRGDTRHWHPSMPMRHRYTCLQVNILFYSAGTPNALPPNHWWSGRRTLSSLWVLASVTCTILESKYKN